MSFDRLDEVRSIARARATESYDYFAHYVLGLRVPTSQSREQWDCVLRGERVHGLVSDTFVWLFPELSERRAAQRAA